MTALLDALVADATVNDYHPEARHARSRIRVAAVATAMVLASLIGTTLRSTDEQAGQNLLTRQALLARVHQADARVATLETAAREAARDLQAAETAALTGTSLGDQALARVARLRAAAGFDSATGRGVEVTLDDSADTTQASGRVLDRDIQMVVNALWQGGATAIAINDRRLTSASAIRSAGEAVLVNYRPLVPPYHIRAIAQDNDALAGEFRDSAAGLMLEDLQAKYGIVWDVITLGRITIPAATTDTTPGGSQ